MRVIAGKYKNRQLKTPSFSGTRPMTDKVREALFNTLGDEVVGADVLDLYAGTGAVGIEALSRGAKEVTFVDKSQKCQQLIKHNLEQISENSGSMRCMDVSRFIEKDGKIYDLIFFTPPYAILDQGLVARAGQLLRPDGTLVVEYGVDQIKVDGELTGLALYHEREYGDTGIQLYVKVETK